MKNTEGMVPPSPPNATLQHMQSSPQSPGKIPDSSSFAQGDAITITQEIQEEESQAGPWDVSAGATAQRALGNPWLSLTSSQGAAGLEFLRFSGKKGPLSPGFLA